MTTATNRGGGRGRGGDGNGGGPNRSAVRVNTSDGVTAEPVAAAGPVRAPRWAVLGSLLAAVAGLGVSIYLTVAHYTTAVTLACPQSATVNCEKVTTSAQSEFLGMPVALLGAVFFAAMATLCSPPAWRASSRTVHWVQWVQWGQWVHWVRALAALGGVGFVAWLVYAELFVIDAICLWCTTVHVLAVILFCFVALGTATRDADA